MTTDDGEEWMNTYIELPSRLPNRAPFTFERAMQRGVERRMHCQVLLTYRANEQFQALCQMVFDELGS